MLAVIVALSVALMSPAAPRPIDHRQVDKQPDFTPPAVRFAPLGVKVTFRLARGRIVRDCTVETFGDPDGHWLDNPCQNIAAPEFMNLIGIGEETEGRMTALLTLEANRRTVDTGTATGRLIVRSSASFELAPDGSVTRCAPERAIGSIDRFDLCRGGFPRRERPFQPATDQESRQGVLTLSFYLDSDTTA